MIIMTIPAIIELELIQESMSRVSLCEVSDVSADWIKSETIPKASVLSKYAFSGTRSIAKTDL